MTATEQQDAFYQQRQQRVDPTMTPFPRTPGVLNAVGIPMAGGSGGQGVFSLFEARRMIPMPEAIFELYDGRFRTLFTGFV